MIGDDYTIENGLGGTCFCVKLGNLMVEQSMGWYT